MAEFPALPLWTDAYLGDTTHLTTIEHGAYLLLLMTAWRTSDCLLPDDDRLLARYARLSPAQWKRMRPIMAEFFTISDGKWRQGRLSDEREAVKRHRETQSEKGKRGAVAKSLKSKGRHQAGANLCLISEEAQGQPEVSSHTHTHIPLDKESNGGDADQILWESAKSFLKPERADPGSLIGKWCRDFGKEATAQAITKAQLERPAQRIPFVEACLRKSKQEQGNASSWDFMP